MQKKLPGGALPGLDAAPDAPAPATDSAILITLSEPIQRTGGAAIEAITLRKPKAGELRGLKLQDLMQSDVNTIIAVLPRISQPFITDAEAASLSCEDIAEIGGAILGFFMSRDMKAMIDKMQGG